jgi:ribonuclease HI
MQRPMGVWDVTCDGGCPVPGGPGAYAFVVREGCTIKDAGEHSYPDGGEKIGGFAGFLPRATNNEAEYRAVNAAAIWLRNDTLVPSEIRFWGDSQLITYQLTGRYKVRDEDLRPFFDDAKNALNALRKLSKVSLHWFRRAYNSEADELCNRVFDRHGVPLKKKRV